MNSRNIRIKCNIWKCGRKRIILALILITFAVVFSSGCLNPGSTEIPKTEFTNMPDDINAAILDFSLDVADLDRVISIDLYNLAEEFGDAETDTDREKSPRIIMQKNRG